MPRKQSVGPRWSPSAVWLNTTSRMTSMPARCSALTMSRNSSTGPERILPRAVRLMRRKERDRRIAPVVDLARRTILGIELKYRQQFHGGDAELLKVRNLLDQSCIGAAVCSLDAGTWVAREPADVHFVNDGPSRGPIAAGRPPPSRKRSDRRRHSSSPSPHCRLRGCAIARL